MFMVAKTQAPVKASATLSLDVGQVADLPAGRSRKTSHQRGKPPPTSTKELEMADVIANMSMSLDGFVADPEDRVDHLFGWFGNGDVEVPTAAEWATFKTSEA